MDRSQRQLSRSERISNSPYKRPSGQAGVNTPKSPISPLLPQTNQDLQIEDDQNSVSGSEDGWNGSAPPGMESEDVSSLAIAGRRGLEGDIREGGHHNHETTLAASTSQEIQPSQPIYPTPLQRSTSHVEYPSEGTSQTFSSTPSQSIKRSIHASTSTMPSRRPLPSFLPQAAKAAPAQSAATVALAAFVEAKRGDAMNAHDMRVMRTLMEEMEAEQNGTIASGRSNGWTAAVDSPRQVKTLRSVPTAAGPSTPNRLVHSIRDSPGPLFSVGSQSGRVDASGAESPASRRIRYLGPGMSPKRMLNKSRTPSDKPLFTSDVAEESEPKRQKVQDAPETPDRPFAPSQQASPSPSVPSSLPPMMSNRALDKIKATSTPAKPSPLSRSTGSTPPQSPREQASIQQGKRRAADIVKELMEEEIGPIETLSKRDYMVINPYDISPASTSQAAEAASLSRSVSKNATPRKSILRSSLKSSSSTPLSGAAAKLEAHKPGRKLTTLELLEGKRPWTGSADDHSMRSQTSSPGQEAFEVDELMDESPAPSRARSISPAPAPKSPPPQPETSKPMPKMPEPFETAAFKVPEVSSPARPLPAFSTSPAPVATSFALPPANFALAPVPAFNPVAHKPTPPLPEIENSTLASMDRRPAKTAKNGWSAAQTKVFGMSSASLPSFVFKITAPSSTISPLAREAALHAATQHFDFDLSANPKSAPKAAIQSTPAGPWTCSMCMLQNPASATEKCTICEEPRPALKSMTTASTPSFMAFGSAPAKALKPSSGADWTCDTCMLKNPDSAKEKCQICEARRPATKGSFSFGQPATKPTPKARAPGPWTCGLCGLSNPETATEKCQICEEKRP